jgi:hypothetical protein
MSSICHSVIPMEMNSELLKENWDWVDQRLENLYHGYGITEDNYEDYLDAGLLVKIGSWIDNELQNQYDNEFEDTIPCPAPISWVNHRDNASQHCLEEVITPRSRAESDISDHSDEVERVVKRLNCQSPLPTGLCHIYYNHVCVNADEVESVSSQEGDNGFDDCSTIGHCSETSPVMDWYIEDTGYDSF